jgi:hypothetical protein
MLLLAQAALCEMSCGRISRTFVIRPKPKLIAWQGPYVRLPTKPDLISSTKSVLPILGPEQYWVVSALFKTLEETSAFERR